MRRTIVPLQDGDRASTLTREQIRKQHIHHGHVSPRFGDGGWHTTPGCQQFTTEWEPRNDKIMVRLKNDFISSLIARPEIAAADTLSRRGTVLKVGPGKRIPGTWWYFESRKAWEWIEGYRQQPTVKPGDEVIVGQWSDWESADAGWGENIVLCQEADVRVILTA